LNQPSNSPFLKNNGAEAPKGLGPIVRVKRSVSQLYLKSTCDVNLLSKLSIIFKEWRVIVLFVLLK
jgi:hypothetical protein